MKMGKLGAMLLAASMLAGQATAALPVNTISAQFPASASATPLDGRLILIVTPKDTPEPRMQVHLEAPLRSGYIFGKTVDGWKPGTPATMDASAKGWPVALADLPEGDYSVQAVLNRYETYHRGDGSVVKLPPDMGEGQHWERKPGNLYSKPVRIHLGPGTTPLTLALDQVIAPITPPADTPFVKHIRIQSALLTRYWGRPTYLGAYVLLPAGFAEHPNAHYPLMVNHGHFPEEGIDAWRETPPDPNLKPDYSDRFHLAGYNRIQQEESYKNYQKWTSKDFPRFLVIQIEHANPYFDDSYAVNSANLGPYGDAINQELLPEVEKQFRGIGRGWARFTYGGSTGGWEAMATQVLYPDMYNGAFIACPDPIDFHAYTTINLYKDKNAFYEQGLAVRNERIAMRDYLGQNISTQRDQNIMELVMGDKSRSGGQYDIWQAVFSPQGKDGYPQPIFDKETGEIDHAVADYWREHFDLTHIVERDWKKLAPRLQGKLHIYVGSADTYFLTNAVYYAQDTLEKLQPAYGGSVDYGDRAEHCWNGDHQLSNAYSRLHYTWMYLPIIMDRIARTAPKGADLTSWRY